MGTGNQTNSPEIAFTPAPTVQRLYTLIAWTILTVAFASGTLLAHAQIESTGHSGH
jgi:hypothetical protein